MSSSEFWVGDCSRSDILTISSLRGIGIFLKGFSACSFVELSFFLEGVKQLKG